MFIQMYIFKIYHALVTSKFMKIGLKRFYSESLFCSKWLLIGSARTSMHLEVTEMLWPSWERVLDLPVPPTTFFLQYLKGCFEEPSCSRAALRTVGHLWTEGKQLKDQVGTTLAEHPRQPHPNPGLYRSIGPSVRLLSFKRPRWVPTEQTSFRPESEAKESWNIQNSWSLHLLTNHRWRNVTSRTKN